jgi:hypothetical protein
MVTRAATPPSVIMSVPKVSTLERENVGGSVVSPA